MTWAKRGPACLVSCPRVMQNSGLPLLCSSFSALPWGKSWIKPWGPPGKGLSTGWGCCRAGGAPRGSEPSSQHGALVRGRYQGDSAGDRWTQLPQASALSSQQPNPWSSPQPPLHYSRTPLSIPPQHPAEIPPQHPAEEGAGRAAQSSRLVWLVPPHLC